MKSPLSNSFEKAKETFFAKNPSPHSTSSSRADLTHRKNFSLKNLILILLKQLNNGLLKYLFIGLIKLYQWTLGPFTQGQCRFYPSCSEYGLAAFKKYGVFKGSYLTIKRILKCNPWHSGGPDPLP